MTKEEAISTLCANVMVACERAKFDSATCNLVEDALCMAIEALEKQIPKPVEFVTDYTWAIGNEQPICPVCESDVSKIVFFPVDEVEAKDVSYCEFCGQAIDWSEGDD